MHLTFVLPFSYLLKLYTLWVISNCLFLTQSNLWSVGVVFPNWVFPKHSKIFGFFHAKGKRWSAYFERSFWTDETHSSFLILFEIFTLLLNRRNLIYIYYQNHRSFFSFHCVLFCLLLTKLYVPYSRLLVEFTTTYVTFHCWLVGCFLHHHLVLLGNLCSPVFL